MNEFFAQVPKDLENPTADSVKKWLDESSTSKAVALFPVLTDNFMYYIHQYYIELELNKALQETKDIQTKVKSLLPLLPDGTVLII